MRVLLVEDHLQLAESIAQALKSTGLTVDVLHDGVAADLALGSEEYAVAILDVGLPRMDGFEVLARLRARGKNLPVLMLTARSDVKDRVHGLNLGADDYLAKPFELTELEARVKALLRRSVLGGERQQRCGVLAYDLDTRRFTLGEELLTLTSREQAVLEALIARPGRVMSKEQLASQVFGLDEEASPDAIEIPLHLFFAPTLYAPPSRQPVPGLCHLANFFLKLQHVPVRVAEYSVFSGIFLRGLFKPRHHVSKHLFILCSCPTTLIMIL